MEAKRYHVKGIGYTDDGLTWLPEPKLMTKQHGEWAEADKETQADAMASLLAGHLPGLGAGRRDDPPGVGASMALKRDDVTQAHIERLDQAIATLDRIDEMVIDMGRQLIAMNEVLCDLIDALTVDDADETEITHDLDGNEQRPDRNMNDEL